MPDTGARASGGTVPMSYRTALSQVLLVCIFALPCLVGKPIPYLLLFMALAAYLSADLPDAFRRKSHNAFDLVLVLAYILISACFMISARFLGDARDLLRFLPLLIAIPARWLLERDARRSDVALLSMLSLAGAAFAVLVGALQVFAMHVERAGDKWLNSIQFADTAMLLGFMSLAGFFAAPFRYRWLLLLGPILGSVAAVLAGTRGALIAAPVFGFLALALALATMRRKAHVLGGAALVLVAVALGIAFLFAAGHGRALLQFDVLTQAFNDPSQLEQSAGDRVRFVVGGYRAFLDSPWIGHGWGHMVDSVVPYLPASEQARMSEFGHLHNEVMNFAVSAGIVGLLVYLALLAAPILGVFQTPRDRDFAGRLYMALTLSAGQLVFGLTNVMFGFEHNTTLFGFVAVAILASRPRASAA